MFIDDPYTAYCLDEAVYYFGTEVEAQVEAAMKSTGKADNQKQREHRGRLAMSRLLGITAPFADPSALAKKG